MVSPSWFCGVGERDRFRRMGEQAGVLRFELLAVLWGQMERRMERGGGGKRGSELLKAQRRIPRNQLREPGLGAGLK